MELYVTVEELKQHLNIDYEGEESYLESILQTSQMSVEKAIQQPLSNFESDGTKDVPLSKLISKELILSTLTTVTDIDKIMSIPVKLESGFTGLNPMLKHAIKILAGGFYANREPIAYAQPKPVPYTLDYLLQPFKKYT